MTFFSIFGTIAALLTTGAYVPQAYKTIKTKSAGDLSIITFLMMSIGTIFWLVHGVINDDLPLIIGNAITSMLSMAILYIKLRYREK